MFAPADLEGDTREELFLSVGLGQIIYAQDLPAALDAGSKGEVHVVAQFHRFFKDFRFLEHFFAALSAPDGLLAVEAP